LLNILQILYACPSSPSSMPMILMFGLLMESVSYCIFFSQVLSCLTNSSSVFLLISISSSSSEILSSAWSGSLLEWPSILFCISVSFYFFEVFHIMGHLLFNIINFVLNSFVSLLMVFCFTLVFI
jgi:hypothetical protein